MMIARGETLRNVSHVAEMETGKTWTQSSSGPNHPWSDRAHRWSLGFWHTQACKEAHACGTHPPVRSARQAEDPPSDGAHRWSPG